MAVKAFQETGEPSLLQVTLDVAYGETESLILILSELTENLGVKAVVLQDHPATGAQWPEVEFTGTWAGLEAMAWRYQHGPSKDYTPSQYPGAHKLDVDDIMSRVKYAGSS